MVSGGGKPYSFDSLIRSERGLKMMMMMMAKIGISNVFCSPFVSVNMCVGDGRR